MGLSVGSSSDFVSDQADEGGEGLVGNQEADQQSLSDSRRGMNWTAMLAAKGLESPGYHEVIRQMKKEHRIKDKKSR